MREQLAGGTSPEFFEFFGELACDAELPLRHNIDACDERLCEAVRRLEEDTRLIAVDGCSQFSLALPAFHGKKPTKTKSLRRKSRTEECDEN